MPTIRRIPEPSPTSIADPADPDQASQDPADYPAPECRAHT